ncbi:hypothetical protein GCM10027445_59460 [Amycolatopsis endophytica]
MSLHAFIDESARAQIYPICVAVVDPAQLAPARKQLLKLLLAGRIASLPVTSHIYGAGGDWRRRIMPVVQNVIEV